MISTDYLRTMARYNRWQNRSHIAVADALGDEARRLERGAFFGSIHRTMSHLLWGDRMWMSRFDGLDRPEAKNPAEGSNAYEIWDDLKREREVMDDAILDWAGRETQERLDGDLTWYSGILKADTSKPFGMLAVHFFNHGTHHRGQIHAMLTAAGGKPADTDLFLMPDDA
jgi:uncharacterized damage-inducible protein DinB